MTDIHDLFARLADQAPADNWSEQSLLASGRARARRRRLVISASGGVVTLAVAAGVILGAVSTERTGATTATVTAAGSTTSSAPDQSAAAIATDGQYERLLRDALPAGMTNVRYFGGAPDTPTAPYQRVSLAFASGWVYLLPNPKGAFAGFTCAVLGRSEGDTECSVSRTADGLMLINQTSARAGEHEATTTHVVTVVRRDGSSVSAGASNALVDRDGRFEGASDASLALDSAALTSLAEKAAADSNGTQQTG